jgi:drug/metabolite transporter (DMT)-like permease
MSSPAPALPRISLLATPAGAYLLLSFAMLSWSGNAVVGRAFAGTVPPMTLSFARWTVAFLIVLPFTMREVIASRAIIRRDWRILAALGCLGIVGSNVLSYTGLQYTTAINAGLLNSVGPVMILVATAACFGERVTLRQIVGIALSLGGVAIIVLRGEPATLLALEFNRGDLLMLAAIAVWSGYSLMIRYRPTELSPLGLLSVLFAIGAATTFPLHLWAAAQHPVTLTPLIVLGFLYVGIFPGVLSILCWNRGVHQIGPNRASIFNHLMPLFSALLAMIFLGEELHAFHFLGGLFIFSGLALAAAAPRQRKSEPRAAGIPSRRQTP